MASFICSKFARNRLTNVFLVCKVPTINQLGETDSEQRQVDLSSAPMNVSMMKVALGWALNWVPPKRVPGLNEQSGSQNRIEALASQSSSSVAATGSQHLYVSTDGPPEAPGVPSQSGSSVDEESAIAAYSIEVREKGTTWHQLATSKENSLLLKDLKPGSEYMFRIIAHSPAGARGTPSPTFRYTIPDNRRKPGSTQALSAGVVSGVLFFIASIVIAVCAVNMCNKRRKKRAEKGKLRWVRQVYKGSQKHRLPLSPLQRL